MTQPDHHELDVRQAEDEAHSCPYAFDDVDRHLRHLWEGEARSLLYPRRPDSQVSPLGGRRAA